MKWLTFVGIVAAALAIAALWFSIKLWYMMTMFLISGIGIGIGLPCLDAMITEGIEKEERGTISSIYSSMRFIGVAAGPPNIALLMKHQLIGFLLHFVVCKISLQPLLLCLRLNQVKKKAH